MNPLEEVSGNQVLTKPCRIVRTVAYLPEWVILQAERFRNERYQRIVEVPRTGNRKRSDLLAVNDDPALLVLSPLEDLA